MIYRQLPDGESQLFQYDTENQLILAEIKKNSGESQTWEYAYDPFGRRLSKERTDKGALTATAPKQTHFVWDGSRLLQEYNYRGSYSYIYTDQDSYEPLAQIFNNAKDGKQYLSYFHTDQIGIPREMTDQLGNLLWYGEYTAWGRLKTDERVYQHAHQPFRLQNQYCDEETGLHYNLMRYYEPDAGRFVNQDPIGLWGGDNLYSFAPNAQNWVDFLGLSYIAQALAAGRTKPIDPKTKKPCKRLHGHHIVFKGEFSDKPKMQEALAPAKQILKDYGIGIHDDSNLMIVPNKAGVHTVDNATKVSTLLGEADESIKKRIEKKEIDESQRKCEMEKALQRVGEKVFGHYC